MKSLPLRHSPTAWALAAVAGVGVQLQQSALWPLWCYAAIGVAAVLLCSSVTWSLLRADIKIQHSDGTLGALLQELRASMGDWS